MPNFFLSPIKKKQYLLLAVDVLIVLLALWISELILTDKNLASRHTLKVISHISLIVIIYIFSLYVFSLYNLSSTIETRRSKVSILTALAVGFSVLLLLSSLLNVYYTTRVLIGHFVILVIGIYGWRLFFLKFVIIRDAPLRIILLGKIERLENFINDFKENYSSGFKIVGAYCKSSTNGDSKFESIDGTSSYALNRLLSDKKYDLILYDTKDQSFERSDVEAIIEARFNGKAIYDVGHFYQELTGKTPIEIIHGAWLINTTHIQGREKRIYFRIKRLIDISLSFILLILFLPVFILIAICLKLSGLNNVLFIQERLCTHRNRFKCIKFRTMSVALDKDKQQPEWATNESDRITPLGRLLRRYRLDELPQLWNILKGEMSFVGPRPIREHFANELAKEVPFYNLRFIVKPGLSGWAQVNLGYADSFESQLEKFKFELFYLQNMSFLLDTIIIIKTIQKVLKGEGA